MTSMKFVQATVLAAALAASVGHAVAEDGVVSIAAESGTVNIAGTVQWSAGTDALGLPVVIADARFDDALTVHLEMRRNTGLPVPASHLIEVAFSPGGGFGANAIGAMLRIAVRTGGEEGGSAFVGAIAPTGANTFTFAMNDRPAGVERNAALAANGAYWDLVLVDDSARTVVVTLAVGEQGAGVLEAAFAAWAGN